LISSFLPENKWSRAAKRAAFSAALLAKSLIQDHLSARSASIELKNETHADLAELLKHSVGIS
jgi:hypothetical protein